MKKINRQNKLLITAAMTMPLIFLFGIWRSIGLLRANFNSLVVFCVKRLEMLISYFSHLENFLLFILSALLILGFVKGVVFFVNQLYNSNKIKIEFKAKLAKNYLKRLYGIDILIVEDKRLFALTVGFLQPAIYISSGLIRQLNTNEIKSVILHEHYHQVNYHPLIKLIIRTSKSFLFFVPVMPVIVKQFTLWQEALADSVAIEKTSRQSLVSAFLKISLSDADLDKVSATVSHFSITKDRLLLVVERAKTPSVKFPIILSSLSLLMVSFFMIFLAWPYTLHAHAQNSSSTNSVRGNINVCHRLNQSLPSIISTDYPESNPPPEPRQSRYVARDFTALRTIFKIE